MHQFKLALTPESSIPTSVIPDTTLIPTPQLELLLDTELCCMREVTIGCSNLALTPSVALRLMVQVSKKQVNTEMGVFRLGWSGFYIVSGNTIISHQSPGSHLI